jgi:hypothetical protein
MPNAALSFQDLSGKFQEGFRQFSGNFFPKPTGKRVFLPDVGVVKVNHGSRNLTACQ